MITLTHLAIAAVLLITLGAFLVQRSAIERARSYKRGKADSLSADAKRQGATRPTDDERSVAGKPDRAPTTSELMARWRAVVGQSDENAAAEQLARSLQAAFGQPKPIVPQRSENIPRSLLTEFPFNKD